MEKWRKFPTSLFLNAASVGALAAVFGFLLGANFECPGAVEARPPFRGLQEQIDELRNGQIRVFDGSGLDLGPLVFFDGETREIDFYSEPIGAVVSVNWYDEIVMRPLTILFEEPDCQGNAWINTEVVNALYVAGPEGTERFFVSTGEFMPLAEPFPRMQSQLRADGCSETGKIAVSRGFTGVEEVTELPFPLQLEAPLTVGPAAP